MLDGGSAWVEVESILPGNMPKKVSVSPTTHSLTSVGKTISNTNVTSTYSNKIYLQLAAFSVYNSADIFLKRMRTELPKFANTLAITAKNGLFKVHTGPYANQILARQAADKISESLLIRPIFLVW